MEFPHMPQKVRIIGVPMDLGQSRRGVDMGPSALRRRRAQAAIKKLGPHRRDIGQPEVKQPERNAIRAKNAAKYLQEIAETCQDIARAWTNCSPKDSCPWCWVETTPLRQRRRRSGWPFSA